MNRHGDIQNYFILQHITPAHSCLAQKMLYMYRAASMLFENMTIQNKRR
jgi:hypothetical protein